MNECGLHEVFGCDWIIFVYRGQQHREMKNQLNNPGLFDAHGCLVLSCLGDYVSVTVWYDETWLLLG